MSPSEKERADELDRMAEALCAELEMKLAAVEDGYIPEINALRQRANRIRLGSWLGEIIEERFPQGATP